MCYNCFLIKDQENTIKYQKKIILEQQQLLKKLYIKEKEQTQNV
jgi:hypothetical protein